MSCPCRRSLSLRLAGVALGLALALATPSGVTAQADVGGTWMLEVTTDNGVTRPTVSLEQDGATLTGRYSSDALGQAAVEGLVAGRQVTFSFSANAQGQSFSVVYQGTLDEDGLLTGSVDIAGGMLTGTFRGTRRPS